MKRTRTITTKDVPLVIYLSFFKTLEKALKFVEFFLLPQTMLKSLLL